MKTFSFIREYFSAISWSTRLAAALQFLETTSESV